MKFRLVLGAVMVAALCAMAATGVATAAPPNSLTCAGGNIHR